MGRRDPGVEDTVVWDALVRLYGIDSRHGPDGDYLVSDDEVRQWLHALQA